ncbi:uncharacterized protein SPAPADRAFT_62278 [Spathaspora passalidarum NRRL Y-27907]|uniref:SAGA-associated factor 11 n=1 Tax=Spathaspora passalidarum (strain NRRL Y-27907 / 11-Y1) TaxID=619300 RepID=G3AR01_SPAPN|nr:uncharacterized protein SPAPADRAFT_62278 [Spathaspora passalidarum NRRL Y-27907]EGW31662.1 hypothetical protein SPAPADRAFT_62278 [Spathaspora passalidarum NRRL Y-27907]
MTEGVTVQELAESIFDDLVLAIINQQTLTSYANHTSIKSQTARNEEQVQQITNLEEGSKLDVYGQDKIKLKSAETSRYFSCENCGRKIAGGRFASHVNKCLERRRK